METEKNIENVIILGSGPAGLAAALYAARGELSPLVLTGMQLGGQASLTDKIENYPGFPEGIGGSDLGGLFQKQAEKFGARIEYDTVLSVNLKSKPFEVKTYSKQFFTHTIIIATGASPILLQVPGEKELTGRGVSYCATCDGYFFRDKELIVVGGGDSALEEAILLTRYATKVTVIHRRNELRAGALLQSRAHQNPKISILLDSIVKEIKGVEKVTSVTVENVKTKELIEIKTDGVFIFIGHNPNNQMYQGQLDMDERGYILVNAKMHTNIEGVYAAGEAADGEYKQVVVSAGMGATAALSAIHYLEK